MKRLVRVMDDEILKETCFRLLPETTEFLDRLVRFESLPGYEGPAVEWTYRKFEGLAEVCEKVPVPEDIVNDPEYQFRLDDRPYDDRPNIRIMRRGDGTGKSVIFNAHIDVVPPSVDHERPFDPFVRDGCLYGRGATDDKGQIAVLWTMLRAMDELGLAPGGDVVFHIVIEEETGGNGTLAMVRRGETADCCINLDGGGGIYTSVRGAVWFTGTCRGRPERCGRGDGGSNPIRAALEAMEIIEEYHEELLAATHHVDPLFSPVENPMPVTFGRFASGTRPDVLPDEAVFEGVFGFLTTPKEEVMREMVERVRTRGSRRLGEDFTMTFEYRHDPSRIEPGLPFVRLLEECYASFGVDYGVKGFPASADTCFYTNLAGVPAVLTGMGRVETAHTAFEHVRLEDLAVEAAVMLRFIREWCGFREQVPRGRSK